MSRPAIIKFFAQEKTSFLLSHIAIFVLFTSISSLALIGIINEVAFSQSKSSDYFIYFVVAAAIFAFGTRFLNIQVTKIVERQLMAIRLRVMNKIRGLDLLQSEQLGRDEMHITLSQEVVLVSDSADMFIAVVQQAVMLAFCMCYFAWLSPIAFAIVVGSIGMTYFLINKIQTILSNNFEQLSKEETSLFSRLDHIVRGFKEVRLNRKKSDAIYAEYKHHVKETERLKVHNRISTSWAILSSHLFMYVLLGSIVFAIPLISSTDQGLIGKLVATVLFIITPLLLILEGIPTIERANSSLKRIYLLEERLGNVTNKEIDDIPEFQTLEFKDACFSYLDNGQESGFKIGPISMKVTQGELLFITGGNGSGKSTFLKLLTGLYYPISGDILLNGQLLKLDNIEQLREQFSVIFTDFHLFDRFFGVPNVSETEVNQLIEKMGLATKVRFENGGFSSTALSTGQRKRLALITTLLDDRQIYIFDEWAADQDVHFRHYFYHEVLPELQAKGKTIIAVTHDDRYWPLCDRLIDFEMGKIKHQQIMTDDKEVRKKDTLKKTDSALVA